MSGSEAWEEYFSGLLSLIKDFVLKGKVRLYGEHANVHLWTTMAFMTFLDWCNR